MPGERGPVRGLARLLRRNPTDAERALWNALTKDRRFAGLGFKRATPVGTHITDFVSFPLRLVIDIVPEAESQEAAKTRAHTRGWLAERDYRVVELRRSDVERDVAGALDTIAAAVSFCSASAGTICGSIIFSENRYPLFEDHARSVIRPRSCRRVLASSSFR